ncbi:MAG: hypothetical protein HGA65_17290, partial [Oscillochloris sp.]|nr:hypothetical protein [Oscillochloris sp.]
DQGQRCVRLVGWAALAPQLAAALAPAERAACAEAESWAEPEPMAVLLVAAGTTVL